MPPTEGPTPTAPAALDPAPRRPRFRPPQVQFWGRWWPRAGKIERAAWGLNLLGVIGVLITAWVLQADPSGVGTHEQLGLPECGFIPLFGGPCPSCGFTTTFALAAKGRWVSAVINQPFGFLMFLAALASVPLSVVAITRRVSWLEATDTWHWGKIVAGTLLLWLAGWGYKWWIYGG